jgi:hypothetical protein
LYDIKDINYFRVCFDFLEKEIFENLIQYLFSYNEINKNEKIVINPLFDSTKEKLEQNKIDILNIYN